MNIKFQFGICNAVLLVLAGCAPTPAPIEQYTVNLTAADFGSIVDNPYFPLLPCTKWVYQGTMKHGWRAARHHHVG